METEGRKWNQLQSYCYTEIQDCPSLRLPSQEHWSYETSTFYTLRSSRIYGMFSKIYKSIDSEFITTVILQSETPYCKNSVEKFFFTYQIVLVSIYLSPTGKEMRSVHFPVFPFSQWCSPPPARLNGSWANLLNTSLLSTLFLVPPTSNSGTSHPFLPIEK